MAEDLIPPLPMRLDGAELRYRLHDLTGVDQAQIEALRQHAVGLLKPALTQGRAAILGAIEARTGGLSVARALARQMDEIVSALWDFTLKHVGYGPDLELPKALSLMAVGGYGRGELAPFSDLDLLFLRASKETPQTEAIVQFVLYTLWDLGLKVGHSSRTLDECLKLGRDDHTIMTALLEHRLIAGNRELAGQLTNRLNSESLKSQVSDYIASKLNERDERHNRTGTTRYVVEPNLKEGRGGLRDLHTLYWIAKFVSAAKLTLKSKNALEALLTEKEAQIFRRAFDFLWKARIHLHLIANRGEDRLSFDLQPELARRMGFLDRTGEPAVERFMRRYFVTTKEVGALTRIFCAKLEELQAKPLNQLASLVQSGLMNLSKPDHPGFVVVNNRLSVRTPDLFVKSPLAMFKLFGMADRLGLDLHPDAFTAIARNLDLMTPTLRRDPEASKLFRALLIQGRDPYRTLSMMSETGLLGRYIPEYGRIVAQTQFNMYHAYTVDEHTLRAIDVIHGVDTGRYKEDHPLASTIMPNLQDKESLYLAMLLHDTGKGDEDGQEIGGENAARSACKRLGLEDWQIDQVAWLVRHHLILSDFAQKRDVTDPDTIEAFAKIVETPERLRLLLVLTVADIRAVGPGVWNAWKGQLMRDLFAATEASFRGGRGSDQQGSVQAYLESQAYERLLALSEGDPDRQAFLQTLDNSYLYAASPADVADHRGLHDQFLKTGVGISLRLNPDRQAMVLAVMTKDRAGLFADLAKALAFAGANVVGASVHTTTDGAALDIFYLQDATGQPFGADYRGKLKEAEKIITEAALGQGKKHELARTSVTAKASVFAIAPTVVFDNDATQTATILEVSGRDRRGLLAELVAAISAENINIASAHVDTYGERAVDAFYLTNREDGQKLNKEVRQALRKRLFSVLEDSVGTNPKGKARARASTKR